MKKVSDHSSKKCSMDFFTGDLCHPESCVEEAAKITDQIVKFARETQSASHLEHLLKDQKKWTKGNDIKLLAVIVVEALKAGKTSTAEIGMVLIDHLLLK